MHPCPQASPLDSGQFTAINPWPRAITITYPPLIVSFIPRWYWDLLVVVLLMFTVIVLPVSIAFYGEDQTKPLWLTLNAFVDILFITDIVINFRTGIASANNPDIVSQNYMFEYLLLNQSLTIIITIDINVCWFFR